VGKLAMEAGMAVTYQILCQEAERGYSQRSC